MRHRLFAIDGLAGIQRVDRHAAVPMLGRGDRDVIDFLDFQQLAIVLHRLRRADGLCSLLGPRQPAIGHGHGLDVVRLFQLVDRAEMRRSPCRRRR